MMEMKEYRLRKNRFKAFMGTREVTAIINQMPEFHFGTYVLLL